MSESKPVHTEFTRAGEPVRITLAEAHAMATQRAEEAKERVRRERAAEFEAFVESAPDRDGPFKPFVYHDRDNDLIEFFLSNENYYGKRVDGRLTLYLSQESDEIVGCLIEGVEIEETGTLETEPVDRTAVQTIKRLAAMSAKKMGGRS